jgi:subtilisin
MKTFALTIAVCVSLLMSARALAHAEELLGADRTTPSLQPQIVPDQYIVELRPGVGRDQFLRRHGITPLERWSILHGFVARMSAVAANRFAANPNVLSVSSDIVVTTFAKSVSSGNGERRGEPAARQDASTLASCPVVEPALIPQGVPTGVARIGAPAAWDAGRTGAGIKVAVLDTGIDACHPDLEANVGPGINLLDTALAPVDDHGHGTHVAGTIGATNNAIGVVGVAPGVTIHAVKILNRLGMGTLSRIITGLDWSVQNGMRVANLSLGGIDAWCLLGLCGRGPMCTAVTNATNAGVAVVVAAGNNAAEARFFTPANCRDSITVSAFADSTGTGGASGPPLVVGDLVEQDETFAQSFSNHSTFVWDVNRDRRVTDEDRPVIDFMAPGVAITSTLPTYAATLANQPYGVLTGTSMAAPHVAGAAALFLQANPTATPDEVRRGLLQAAECPQNGGVPAGLLACPAPGWADDPDLPDVFEPLVRATGF